MWYHKQKRVYYIANSGVTTHSSSGRKLYLSWSQSLSNDYPCTRRWEGSSSRHKKHVQRSWVNREYNIFEDLNTIHHILSVEWEGQKSRQWRGLQELDPEGPRKQLRDGAVSGFLQKSGAVGSRYRLTTEERVLERGLLAMEIQQVT